MRRHFLMPEGRRCFRGIMHRVWRRSDWRGRLAAPFLWLGGKMETLFADTGNDVPFASENVVRREPDGRVIMTWNRTFCFPGKTQRFSAAMHFDSRH